MVRITLFFWVLAWFFVGMAGAFLFILIQLVLLVDFAHSCNESWVNRMEEGNPRCWYAGRYLNSPVKAILHYAILSRMYSKHLHWFKCIKFQIIADFLKNYSLPVESILNYMHYRKGEAQIVEIIGFSPFIYFTIRNVTKCVQIREKCCVSDVVLVLIPLFPLTGNSGGLYITGHLPTSLKQIEVNSPYCILQSMTHTPCKST